jgi:hypothetical protein
MSFAQGTKVIYNDMQGVIGFVGDTYVVLQITPKPGSKSPGLIVYRKDYKNIQISKASEK